MEGTEVISSGNQHSNQIYQMIRQQEKKALQNLNSQAKIANAEANASARHSDSGPHNPLLENQQELTDESSNSNLLERPDLKPLAVKRIHMLLDATEKQHLFENLASYSNVLMQYQITPGKVYIFGKPEIPSNAPYDWLRILARGGKIGADYTVAELYGITQSPSWILETAEGDVVLEAFESIDRFLTHKGELKRKYLEPERPGASGTSDEDI